MPADRRPSGELSPGVAGSVTVAFLGPQRPLADQSTVERGVFREMADDQMPAGASRPALADLRGAELTGKRVVQRPHRAEGVEHLFVARRIGTPPGDGVAPVPAVVAGRSEQLQPSVQRVANGRTQRQRLLAS